MWRTSLLLVALAAVAYGMPTLDDKGPLQEHDDVLEAMSPLNENVLVNEKHIQAALQSMKLAQVAENPHPVRHEHIGQALQMHSAGSANIFADDKKVSFTLTVKNTNQATLNFGKKGQSNAINVAIQFDDDLTYVYGKSQCSDKKCRSNGVTTPFDETYAQAVSPAETFSYQPEMAGSASGNLYKGQISIDADQPIDGTFGVANAGQGNPTVGDGLLGLGLQNHNDQNYNAVRLFFDKLSEKAITILRETPSDGKIVFGASTADGCPSGKTGFVETVNADGNNNVKRWWFKASSIKVGDVEKKDLIVQLDPFAEKIRIDKQFVEPVLKKAKDNKFDSLKDLPSLKVKFGDDELVIEPEQYTRKDGDSYVPLVDTITDDKAQVRLVLGGPLTLKSCVILKQSDKDHNSFQIGFLTPSSSAQGIQLSLGALLTFVGMQLWMGRN